MTIFLSILLFMVIARAKAEGVAGSTAVVAIIAMLLLAVLKSAKVI